MLLTENEVYDLTDIACCIFTGRRTSDRSAQVGQVYGNGLRGEISRVLSIRLCPARRDSGETGRSFLWDATFASDNGQELHRVNDDEPVRPFVAQDHCGGLVSREVEIAQRY